MLGPMPLMLAWLRTPPRGRAKWVPGGQLVRSRRLLHGRIWPWPGPTVPRPRWSGISLGQEQFGPCQQGPGRWTMGWRGLPKFCASPETLWLLGVIFNKKLRIYYRGGHVVELEISSESVEMENSWATKAICGDFYRPPPPWAEEISGHRSPAVVRRGPANFSGEAPFRTDWTIFAGKNVGRRGPWAVNPLGHHGWGRNHHRPAAVPRAPANFFVDGPLGRFGPSLREKNVGRRGTRAGNPPVRHGWRPCHRRPAAVRRAPAIFFVDGPLGRFGPSLREKNVGRRGTRAGNPPVRHGWRPCHRRPAAVRRAPAIFFVDGPLGRFGPSLREKNVGRRGTRAGNPPVRHGWRPCHRRPAAVRRAPAIFFVDGPLGRFGPSLREKNVGRRGTRAGNPPVRHGWRPCHRRPAAVRRAPAIFFVDGPLGRFGPSLREKNVGRRGTRAGNPPVRHGWRPCHRRPAAVRRAPA